MRIDVEVWQVSFRISIVSQAASNLEYRDLPTMLPCRSFIWRLEAVFEESVICGDPSETKVYIQATALLQM